ncbi:MAG: phosphoadenylyl-sulfate reductase [Actinomycetota bacterium]|nr:phosphoadenylyl-sulfate reductase [Actinomycetota bacterium]
MGTLIRPRPLDEAPLASGNGHHHVPMIGGERVDPKEISAEVEAMGAEEAIRWAVETFGSTLGFAVSFQKTSSVILDMAHRVGSGDARFFYIDTELLFEETYRTRDRLAERFGIEFERFVQDNPPGLRERWDAGEWGPQDECCAPRKVATMRRALEGAECWVSGVRRTDSETRAGAPRFGWDVRFDRWKLNPLADWDEKQVWTYIKENHVPYNPLHDQGYPSIGCMPCTSKPGAGEDARAGRWAGTDRTECGING